MSNYTDQQLKQALAKMLPELVKVERAIPNGTHLYWLGGNFIKDTELLHLCWLVEETLTDDQFSDYSYVFGLLEANCYPNTLSELKQGIHATWQQRVTALCKVKGVEI